MPELSMKVDRGQVEDDLLGSVRDQWVEGE